MNAFMDHWIAHFTRVGVDSFGYDDATAATLAAAYIETHQATVIPQDETVRREWYRAWLVEQGHWS